MEKFSKLETDEISRLRPLGLTETMEYLGGVLNPGLSNLSIILKSSYPLKIKFIKKSLKILFRQIQFLRCRISLCTLKDQYYFISDVKFENIPIFFKNTGSVSQLKLSVSNQIDRYISGEKYLWKFSSFKYKDSYTLVFTFNHAIVDASALIYFIEKFLNIYSMIENNLKIESKQFKVMPSVEELLYKEKYKTNNSTQKEILTIEPIFNQHFVNHSLLEKITFDNSSEIKQSYWIDYQILPKHLFKLKSFCHTNKLTLNSLLYAIFLISTHIFLNESVFSCKLFTPVGMRKFLYPLDLKNCLGCYANCLDHTYTSYYSTDFKKFIKLAKLYQHTIKKSIPLLLYSSNHQDLSRSEIIKKYFSNPNIFQESFPINLLLSNITFFEIPKMYLPYIDTISINGNRQAAELLFVINVFTINNCLNINFGSTIPSLNIQRVHDFSDIYIDLLYYYMTQR